MGASNLTGANTVLTKEKDEFQGIEDIYIGVFFDGTNNNMNRVSSDDVQKFKKSKKNKNRFIIFKSLFNAITSDANDQSLRSKLDSEKKKQIRENYDRELELNQVVASDENYKLNLKVNGENTYQGEKYSNIAFLTSLYNGKSGSGHFKVLNVYMEGAGATAFTDNGDKNNTGLALGIGITGVVAIVSRAMIFITNYLDSLSFSKEEKDRLKLHFDVFGFSRGATCARVFSYMVCKRVSDMTRGQEFSLYLNSTKLYQKGQCEFLKDYNKENVTVDFLGIYDTVASIGMLEIEKTDNIWHPNFVEKSDTKDNYVVNNLYNKMIGKGSNNSDKDDEEERKEKKLYLGIMKYSRMEVRDNFHRDNVKNYGLFSPCLKEVKHTLHIGAIDEYRENFAFTNVGKTVPKNAIEVLIPGCHSDIGGGYVDGDSNLVTLTIKKLRKNTPKDENTNVCLKEEAKQDYIFSKIVMSYPGDETISKTISVGTLKELGWVWEIENNHNVVSNSFTGTYKKTIGKDYDEESDDEKIQFWNENIKGGYSNIPLKMMTSHAQKKLEDEGRTGIFAPLTHPRVQIPTDINTDVVDKLSECTEGNRYCFCPSDFCSDDYQRLRRTYLHFTASDEWNWGIHKNNFGNILDANAPYRKNNIIGRLMYMGGEGDDNSLHYLNSKDCSFKKEEVTIRVAENKL